MKSIGVFILIYNLILMQFTSCKWYSDIYAYLDIIDIPFYVCAIVVAFKYKKLNLLQKHSLVCVFLSLGLKILYNELELNYNIYSFYFYLITSIPFVLKIERNINYR